MEEKEKDEKKAHTIGPMTMQDRASIVAIFLFGKR